MPAKPLQPVPPGGRIGILGGGQLGRMLALAAARLGLATHIYSDSAGTPAAAVAAHTANGGYDDERAIAAFAAGVDVVTFEFENIPLAAVDAALTHAPVFPPRRALEVAQDRWLEKSFLSELGLTVAPFAMVSSEADLATAMQTVGTPAILKTRRFGYDGKGQARLATAADAAAALNELAGAPAILEGLVPLAAELSVIAVRGRDGAMACYDCPANVHRDGILHTSTVPSGLPDAVHGEATRIARRIVTALDYAGVIGVELFLTQDGRLLVNEIAPRVHNSGHWTMDACITSQFENHIRAIAGWPLGGTARHSDAVMTNLIGDDAAPWRDLATEANLGLHLYGKGQARAGRKMGHVTRISPLRQPRRNAKDSTR